MSAADTNSLDLKPHALSSFLRGRPCVHSSLSPHGCLSGPQVRAPRCPDSPLTLEPTPRWLDCEGLPLICGLLPVWVPRVPGKVLRSGRRQRLGRAAESLQQIFAVPKCVPEGPLLINGLREMLAFLEKQRLGERLPTSPRCPSHPECGNPSRGASVSQPQGVALSQAPPVKGGLLSPQPGWHVWGAGQR